MALFGNSRHPLQQQLDYLADKEQFLDFLDYVAAGRETAIGQLHRANEGRIREISGRIQALDEILATCNYMALSAKRIKRV
jgi:cell division septum initiation protein DivIVA